MNKTIFYSNLICLGLMLIVFISCSENINEEVKCNVKMLELDLSLDEALALRIESNGSTVIPEKEAILMVQKMFMEKVQTKNNSFFEIKSCRKEFFDKIFTKSEENVSCYIVEFTKDGDMGFSIVSADYRVPEVFSFCEKGSISDTVSNKGLKLFCDELAVYMRQKVSSYNQDSLYREVQMRFIKTKGWVDDGNIHTWTVPDVSYVPWDYTYMGSGDTGYEELVNEKLLKTKWGQANPYNGLLPLVSGIETKNGKAWVGCQMVAVAQIMAYHKKVYKDITLNDWNSITLMPDSYNKKLQSLMYDLFYSMKIGDPKVSGTNSSLDKSAKFLKNNGYSVGGECDYDYLDLQRALNTCGPVLLRGGDSSGGHAWLVEGTKTVIVTNYDLYEKDDGYDIWRIKVDIGGTISQYLRCNWGQYGNADGWYSSFTGYYDKGEGKKEPFNYTKNRKMLNGIK